MIIHNIINDKWRRNNAENIDVVVSSTVRLARNLKGYPFPNRLDDIEKIEVASKIIAELKRSNSAIADDLNILNLYELKKDEVMSLVERNLISYDFALARGENYLLLSNDNKLSVMINEQDHIRLQAITKGLDLENVYKSADRLDTLIDSCVTYAFNENFGYLTQCPTNLGTGMCASVKLHLHALNHSKSINRISTNLSKLGLSLKGENGEGSISKDGMYQLSNQVTLGISEQTALENLKNITKQLVAQEKAVREELSKNIEYLDAVSRARGVLTSARILNYDECAKLLSYVRLGVAIGEITDISIVDVDELMLYCKPSIIALQNSEQEQEEVFRANLIRAKLK